MQIEALSTCTPAREQAVQCCRHDGTTDDDEMKTIEGKENFRDERMQNPVNDRRFLSLSLSLLRHFTIVEHRERLDRSPG